MSLNPDFAWSSSPLERDIRHGFLSQRHEAAGQYKPEVVLNSARGATVLRTLRQELARCDQFVFSVAFVTPGAIAILKQDLLEFEGSGLIVTANYLNFNRPSVFHDLYHLQELGKNIDVRIHNSPAFHPKGYIFRSERKVTALVGSSNLTETALTRNHEWNLKVSAADNSDLAAQLQQLELEQVGSSRLLTANWIRDYERSYVPPPLPVPHPGRPTEEGVVAHRPADIGGLPEVQPNSMQVEALQAIQAVRDAGHKRAVVISATGTGKTILSALDVKAFAPRRFLFLVHREQIIDRAIAEYKRVLGGTASDYGKVVGAVRQFDARYVFSTIQSFSRADVLAQVDPQAFDYVLIDEVHRAGANSYQRVLRHLRPQFLLGATATPERSDGFNIFELFDYNVPYEIRLHDALEEDMLVPFHYYGVSDVTLSDGSTIDVESDLGALVSKPRVEHILDAIERYSQQGVTTRGLIFCSRREEAQRLSEELNNRTLGGKPLRTRALTGKDTSEERREAVRQLESGSLDYILTVDIFNEGVDIPTLNQVIMLRQTQSAIIFVQQLGRGLRKASGKDHLTVIDFIGNYRNNYMVPIALFGDKSLNKESLRKNLNAAEEDGVVAGLSSVRFDKIARQRVLDAITTSSLDNLRELKHEIELIAQRVGRTPLLRDFWEHGSVDPVVLATKANHFPALLKRVLGVEDQMTPEESNILHLLSHELLPAKRLHEFVLLSLLLDEGSVAFATLSQKLAASGLPTNERILKSVVDTFLLEGYNAGDKNRYQRPLANLDHDGRIKISETFSRSYSNVPDFRRAVDDVVWTGQRRNAFEYRHDRVFTPGSQYSRRDVSRLLGWARSHASTIYGYRTDVASGVCPIFVTLHKGDDVEASVAYEDELLDPSTMRWYTRSRRTLESREVSAIINHEVDLHVFVKRDDAEGTGFYYLGEAHSEQAEQTTMPADDGKPLNVVRMILRFEEAIEHTLYDYFHPTLVS